MEKEQKEQIDLKDKFLLSRTQVEFHDNEFGIPETTHRSSPINEWYVDDIGWLNHTEYEAERMKSGMEKPDFDQKVSRVRAFYVDSNGTPGSLDMTKAEYKMLWDKTHAPENKDAYAKAKEQLEVRKKENQLQIPTCTYTAQPTKRGKFNIYMLNPDGTAKIIQKNIANAQKTKKAILKLCEENTGQVRSVLISPKRFKEKAKKLYALNQIAALEGVPLETITELPEQVQKQLCEIFYSGEKQALIYQKLDDCLNQAIRESTLGKISVLTETSVEYLKQLPPTVQEKLCDLYTNRSEDVSDQELKAKLNTIFEENFWDSKSVASALRQSEADPERKKLLPLLQAKSVSLENKLDALNEKIKNHDQQIEHRKEKISGLTERAERLEATNRMLRESAAGIHIPGIRHITNAFAKAMIAKNESKIHAIRTEKIPRQNKKLNQQLKKRDFTQTKIDMTQCKLERCHTVDQVLRSFTIPDKAKRQQTFAASMDTLHVSAQQITTLKTKLSQLKISKLNQSYQHASPEMKSELTKKIHTEKVKKLSFIEKAEQLSRLAVPYQQQPDSVVEKVQQHVQEKIENSANAEKPISPDEICMTAMEAVPEQFLQEPEPIHETEMLKEIADLMDISAAELEEKPKDIKAALVDVYTANYNIEPDELKQRMTEVINPSADPPAERKEDAAQQEQTQEKTENSPKENEIATKENANQTKDAHNSPEQKKQSYSLRTFSKAHQEKQAVQASRQPSQEQKPKRTQQELS